MNTPRPHRTNMPAELLRLGYVLLQRLGGGATSEVFEARETSTGRRVALKISRPDVPEAELIVARMQTEWNVGRGLRHPHLVSILNGGVLTDGRAWLAMERLHGRDLLAELERSGALAPTRAVHIMRQVCEALCVLHRRGAVHRDIKPENVFLTEDGRYADHVKVIDLGILALPPGDPARVHEPTGHFIMGTPLYLAPEQARGQPPDARTDLYAVGGVLFHALAGRPPFEGDDPTEVVARHVGETPPRLDTLVEDLPVSLVELVESCLAKNPGARPPSARAVLDRLDDVAADLSTGPGSLTSLRSAPLPEVPPAGHQAEWVRFAEHTVRLIGQLWPRETPPTVQHAQRALVKAQRALESALADEQSHRERADVEARSRIVELERLQRERRTWRGTMERKQRALRTASEAAEEASRMLDTHDLRYAQALARVREICGATVSETALHAVQTRHREVEALLHSRAALVSALSRARTAELGASDVLTEVATKVADLQRTLAQHELSEQEDGFRFEREAEAAGAARLSAQRRFEESALRLMMAYAQAVADGA